jgi:putative transposase
MSAATRPLIQQAYRFELDPNRAQRVLLAKSVGASRFVYNWSLEQSQRDYELTAKRPPLGELKSRLVGLKKGECPWLYEVSAHIGQQALVDLDRAFDRFFKGLKGGGPRSGVPRFKKRGERDSARMYEVELSERHIRLPNIGRLRLKETRTKRGFEGRILSATIRRRADRWFVSLCVEREREIRLNRRLARKQKGSRNRVKAKLELSRLHYRISCLRQDHLHQLTSSLARTKPVIVLEDLHVKGMQRNKHLSLSIGDAGALARRYGVE